MSTDQERIDAQMSRPLVMRLWQALLPLRSVVTFLNTGAHPDDEISGMLAALHRRHGLRVAIACSTRGEGGQNALGGEAGDDLAMLRTREMQRAAEVLDATVYWFSSSPQDPIRDFGFSKDGDDTLARWGHEATLARMVEILRRCRPDIACPTFLDVPGQHGHHRAMTRILIEAVPLAADPLAFPEQIEAGLAPWQVAKLYLPAWSGAGDSYDDDLPPPNATVVLDASGVDPVTGASYARIGQWSRRFHASQGMGRWIVGDDLTYPLHRLDSASPESHVLDGLPVRLCDLAWEMPGATAILPEIDKAIDDAIAAWPNAVTVGPHLATALELLSRVDAPASVAHRIRRKRLEVARALLAAANADVTSRLDGPLPWPGGACRLEIEASGAEARLRSTHDGWATFDEGGGRWRVEVDPSVTLPLDLELCHDPLAPAGPIVIDATVHAFGTHTQVTLPLDAPLSLQPAITLDAEPAALILRQPTTSTTVHLRLRAAADIPLGAIALDQAEGLSLHPKAPLPDRLPAGRSIDLPLELRTEESLAPGLHRLAWHIDGQPALQQRSAGYPHIGTVSRALPAVQRLLRLDCRIAPGTRVAYLGGGNDGVAQALQHMGVDLAELTPQALDDASLEGFSTVVVGILALKTAPGLAERMPALHRFVHQGGHLLTLYHRPWDNWHPERTPLAPLEIGRPSLRWRVTDEAAAVTALDPTHPLLCQPNRIAEPDWQGWTKERALYLASSWDNGYTPLLAMSDPGEAPLLGSLLTGRFGQGRHTHTSLVLHTQLDALTPGAVRLMANLVAPAGIGG